MPQVFLVSSIDAQKQSSELVPAMAQSKSVVYTKFLNFARQRITSHA